MWKARMDDIGGKPGDQVIVFVDPDNPKRSVVLGASFYRILKDPD
jgi:hypothetical protein